MKSHSLLSLLKKTSGIGLLILAGTLLFPGKAQAFYIDPGTGSIIIQVVVGFVVGGLVALKLYWTKFSAWLKRSFLRRGEHEEK